MPSVAENYCSVVARVEAACVRCGRDPREIVILGASKQVGPARIEEALCAGLRHVGENYVQEALGKHESVHEPATWHCIGHLQTNKVKQAVRIFDWIHSLDRLELAREISRRAGEIGRTMQCLVEVNVALEYSKSGIAPGKVVELLVAASGLPNLRIAGLMAIPPVRESPRESRDDFRRVRELALAIAAREIQGVTMNHLSMGMTHDFEIAIEEGANMIRIGTGIFGPRE